MSYQESGSLKSICNEQIEFVAARKNLKLWIIQILTRRSQAAKPSLILKLLKKKQRKADVTAYLFHCSTTNLYDEYVQKKRMRRRGVDLTEFDSWQRKLIWSAAPFIFSTLEKS
jgi:hypothetical protein